VVALVLLVVVLGGLAGLAYGVGVLITEAGGPLSLVFVWGLALSLAVAFPMAALKLASWVYITLHAED
jgi:hypothetical protein